MTTTACTPATATTRSLLGYGVVAGFGFLCLVAACFVVASRYAAEGRRGWAAYSRITGVVFLAGFAGVTTGLPALTYVLEEGQRKDWFGSQIIVNTQIEAVVDTPPPPTGSTDPECSPSR